MISVNISYYIALRFTYRKAMGLYTFVKSFRKAYIQ